MNTPLDMGGRVGEARRGAAGLCAGWRRPGGERGFSLVEVMCAILVLGVGVVGLTQGLATALKSAKETELQTAASLFAAGQVELVRAEGYLTDGETEGTCGGDLTKYRWRQRISDAGIEGLHEVAVTIESADDGGAVYELRTLLFEVPLGTTETESRREREAQRRARRGGGS